MGCIGKILGNRYEIIEEIGSGGMATVYKARCKVLNRFVAIKVLRDEFANDAEFIKRFQVEAQSAASLSHPNIVSIYDVGHEDSMHYIVMELIEGKTLKEVIKENGKLPWRDATKIAAQIASGLSQAHQNHIVHRDIKPHNIIITKDGTAKVTDFGIAKAVSNSTINAFGSTIGSVHYFSPEHARGGYTDEKSDIYSLGIVLYEMCTGKLPFDGETPVAVALKHLQEQPIEPNKICTTLPQSVNDIIMKAMKKDTTERYANATDMYKELQKVLSNPEIEVAKEPVSKEEFPTQRIPIIGAEKPEKIIRVQNQIDDKNKHEAEKEIQKQEIKEKINKYKNEQDDENMSSKKKGVTKTVALIRFFFGLIFVIALFFVSMNAGELFSIKILGEPKEVKVPSLIGYKLEAAIKLLNDEGLIIGKQTEVISEDPKGYVVEQQYEKDFKLKRGSTVDVSISKGQKTVLVPNVVKDTTLRLAKTKIEAVNLVYAEDYEFSDTVASGEIVRQEPLLNAEVVEGSTVTVYISKGPENEGLIKVPDVYGKTEEEASTMISEAELIPRIVNVSKSSEADGIVISVIPEKDTYVSALSEVVVVVNKKLSSNESGETPITKPSDTVTPTPSGTVTSIITPTPTPSKTVTNVLDGKKMIDINLNDMGTRDVFTVKVVLEGQTVGKKIEYEAKHKRSDGTIKVAVTDVKGAMLTVYIDDKPEYEQVL